MLIGITGRKGSGKDTLGRLLRERHGFRTTAFADPLKEAARLIFGLSHEQVHGEIAVKEAPDARWDDLTPREILQRLGTEVGRSIHPETWIRSAMLRIDAEPGAWVVTDVRFANEAAAIQARGGFVVRVDRPGLVQGIGAGHASEAGIEAIPVDFVVVNDGTVEDLAADAAIVARASA